jgi:uncharacterized Zn finger protein
MDQSATADADMNDDAQLRFDVAALRELAGEKTFARGEAYHRGGQVRMLTNEPGRILAQVEGAENYRTHLVGRDRRIGGACSCPAFQDRGFCKHMVAVALAANANDVEAEGEGALSRIRNHLKRKDVNALVAMIVDIAERDPAVFRKLDMAAAVEQTDDKTLEARLRKAIDAATRTRRGGVDYYGAAAWAAEADAVIDALADLAATGRAPLVFRLAERAIDRIEAALGYIDDSEGECTAVLFRARDLHLDAAGVVGPEPAAFARELFNRQTTGQYDTFTDAHVLYADVLGAEGLAEYRRLAAEAWAETAAASGKRRPGEEPSDNSRVVGQILDFFAERDGDVDARIALRARDLSSPWRYLNLAEFCRSQGRETEALRWAEEGLWIFDDAPPDQRLVLFAAERLGKAGRAADAEAHLWRVFERAPSLEFYTRLRTSGGEAARDRALELIEASLSRNAAAAWSFPGDLLVRVLVDEGMIDAAWAALRRHRVSPGVRRDLAGRSEATHPGDALEVYAALVEQLAGNGGDAAYAEATGLITRMAGLRNAREQSAYVEALKARHSRKRNFIKLLG